jgi:acylphosphatase
VNFYKKQVSNKLEWISFASLRYLLIQTSGSIPEMMKIKAEIAGTRVHDVGYRAFLLEAAEDVGLEGFAARNFKQAKVQVIEVLVEGDQPRVVDFRKIFEQERPAKAEVSTIEFEDYDGPVEPIWRYSQRFTGAQLRKGIATLASIDEKQGLMLEKQDETIAILKGVRDDTSVIREKQDQMLEKQDLMLEKQDETIAILKGVRDDTSVIREKQDQMLEKQDESVELLKGVKDDTSAIREGLRQSASSTLEEKYEQLSREITEIKASISEIKAKVS